MIKKAYIVIALGTVSILLGSFFYFSLVLAGDVTSSGKPQPLPTIHKTTLSTSILKVESSGWNSQGVAFIPQGGTYDIPFVFDPTETFLNVTGLWVSCIYGTGGPNTINMYLNDMAMMSLYYDSGSNAPKYESFEVTDTNIRASLESGINILSITVTNTLFMQELTLFIEYEYQA